MAGLVKARALETGWPDATVGEFTLIHEPVWEVERPDGRRIQLSARPGPQGRFAQVRTPGGERALVEPRLHKSSSEWIEPQLAPESLPEVAARVLGQPIAIKTVRLIHHPIFQGTVRIAGVSYPFHLDAVSGELIDVNWPIQATYARRNRAWLATAAMLAAAALLPLPIAAVAALAIVGLAALTLSRRDPTPAASRS